MRILQLIDSLDAGGAERMAVNYANALQKNISFSGLCTTRKEGQLRELLSSEVAYLFLEKKKTLDFKALFRLQSFVKKNRIEFIHAHSSSYFTAVLLKVLYPKIKIVWHDHFGARHLQPKNKNLSLKAASLFFNRVLTINFENKKWLEAFLYTAKINYFPNFIPIQNDSASPTKLNGEPNKRIVFLANLKNPKNHLQFLKVFYESKAVSSNWSLHLIGNDYEDGYAGAIKMFIKDKQLENNVFLYGSCIDTFAILNQATIGVLCSTYEGFPVTILEYAMSKLAVLSTNVGFCSEIIEDGKNGFLFSPDDNEQIKNKLTLMIENSENIIGTFAQNLYDKVLQNYTDDAVIRNYIKLLANKK